MHIYWMHGMLLSNSIAPSLSFPSVWAKPHCKSHIFKQTKKKKRVSEHPLLLLSFLIAFTHQRMEFNCLIKLWLYLFIRCQPKIKATKTIHYSCSSSHKSNTNSDEAPWDVAVFLSQKNFILDVPEEARFGAKNPNYQSDKNVKEACEWNSNQIKLKSSNTHLPPHANQHVPRIRNFNLISFHFKHN